MLNVLRSSNEVNLIDTMTVGVVIATRNRPEPLRRCLETLLIQTRPTTAVIVVDSSDNHLTEKVATAFSVSLRGLVYIRTEVASAARQRNRGAEELNTDVVLFLDDDVTLDR